MLRVYTQCIIVTPSSLPHTFCIVIEGRIVQVKKEPKAGLSLLVQVEKVHYDEIGLIKAKGTVEVTGYKLTLM